MGQVVDTDTAKEFMRETLERVESEELTKICGDVEAKSAWFRQTFAPDALPDLTTADWTAALSRIFATRGKPRKALGELDLGDVRSWVGELIWGPGDVAVRFQTFVDRMPQLSDNLGRDFASELLHFTDPEKNWLWTRWMWDPKTRTGALPLVTTAAYDLEGDNAA